VLDAEAVFLRHALGMPDAGNEPEGRQAQEGFFTLPVAPVPAADYRKAEEPRQGMNDPESDPITMSVMRDVAGHAAAMWSRYVRPMPFERIYYINGARVLVSVSDYKTADDTQPIRTAQDDGLGDG
jgi:hypothetical protein